ncbi:hypothetical protein D3C72_2009630 [compost metagenome]
MAGMVLVFYVEIFTSVSLAYLKYNDNKQTHALHHHFHEADGSCAASRLWPGRLFLSSFDKRGVPEAGG